MAPVDVVPLTTVLGAEVSGVDPGSRSGRRHGHRHCARPFFVTRFCSSVGNRSIPASLTGLARLFGEPTEAHPVEPSVEGHPEVLALDADEGARADVWHSDLTFQQCPPMGALLHALVVPAVGGDTIWSDMAATYEAMSPTLRGFLDGLTASHSPTKAGGYFSQRDPAGDKARRTAATEPIHHPVVRVHPETGGRSLFVNPLFTDKVDGLRRSESDALLGVIQNVAVQPERLVRWHWREGDVAFWDNRCTMHYALLEFSGPRRMNRVALRRRATGRRPRLSGRARRQVEALRSTLSHPSPPGPERCRSPVCQVHHHGERSRRRRLHRERLGHASGAGTAGGVPAAVRTTASGRQSQSADGGRTPAHRRSPGRDLLDADLDGGSLAHVQRWSRRSAPRNRRPAADRSA